MARAGTTTSSNSTAMARSRAEASQTKQADVAKAIQELLLDGTAISVAQVASRAGTSRQFIYGYPDSLLVMVETAMATQRNHGVKSQRAPRTTFAGNADLRSDLALANQEIKRLRAENASLRSDLRVGLGASLEAEDHQASAELLAEKSREINRLVSDCQKFKLVVAGLQAVNDELTEDLAAERRANIAIASDDNVRVIRAAERTTDRA